MLKMAGKQEFLSPMLDPIRREVNFEDTTDSLRRESFFRKLRRVTPTFAHAASETEKVFAYGTLQTNTVL